MWQKFFSFLLVALSPFSAIAQNAVVYGTVKDDQGNGIELVNIAVQGTSFGTNSKPDGRFEIEVPTGGKQIIVFSNVSFELEKRTVNLNPGERKQLDLKLKKKANTLTEFVKKDDRARYEAGSIQIQAKKANELPSTIGGIEGILKTFVGSNNELTSQYTVRGGNFDENLVYVNDFEIYRPFLVRSGQQEGLSFINADLVSNVNFSIGGFQARYGDKMSSVLDVTYRKPKEFSGGVMLSLLGASVHLSGASKNEKLSYLIGLRQKSNQYLLQSQPTKGVYNPSFTDVQALVNYQLSKKWEVEIIANYARNRFNFLPEEQTTSFGVINQAYQLRVFYQGSEIDQFDSRFGGISTTYRPNEKLKLKLLASGFQTNERETYDISGEYLLGELETDLGKENFGQIKTFLGTGIVHNYARNYLKVNVGNIAHRGSLDAKKHFISWGVDANFTSIEDRLHEWERRDSAGFTQPYFEDSLVMKRIYRSTASFAYTRVSGFIQDNFRFNDSLDLTVSAGVRFNYNMLNNEFIISPRVQLAYKPEWKKDIVFKLAGGLYAQPPFYREMRDLDGNVNKDLKAQKSMHIVLGSDYNFKMYNRPFKVTTEFYYKKLWDVVPYEYDNVRIRYFGKNNAVGYAYGGEVRLYGDLVKDATSWVSIGLMKTMEDVTDDKITYKDGAGADSATIYPGYVPRPTDQRFMLGMYFEDYLPRNKNFKAHLNLMYSTGLPFGPPDKQRYGDTLRLPDYKRVDIGFSALLLDGAKPNRPHHSFFQNLQSIWLSLEVFNLLGIQNTLSYSWIQDQTTNKTYAVPNRLTSRLLNLKLVVNF
ncbi:MAG TPA: TonB-dependent receptor [Flavipsychrobacter sp.]|nr:TonB-dependent receptor [Flavipsychrobacter sp.]